jgi:hypothetical protein
MACVWRFLRHVGGNQMWRQPVWRFLAQATDASALPHTRCFAYPVVCPTLTLASSRVGHTRHSLGLLGHDTQASPPASSPTRARHTAPIPAQFLQYLQYLHTCCTFVRFITRPRQERDKGSEYPPETKTTRGLLSELEKKSAWGIISKGYVGSVATACQLCLNGKVATVSRWHKI